MKTTLTSSIIRRLSALLLLFSTAANAQVSFSTQNSLIYNIGGTGVADCAADMNGDGLDDIVRVVDSGIHIDYQQANGGFTHSFYPMSVQTSPTWSIVAADIDGNGFTDLCFGGGSRVSFVYANDTGTGFTETQHPEYIFTQRTTFADIDNDGNLDAFACHDVALSHPYRNVNGVLQLDQTLISTVPIGGNYAAIWVDYDNDHDIDLYMTKCRGGASYTDNQRINKLYRNNGDGSYTEVSAEANMNDANQSWATAFEDYDNDGDFDAFIANHSSSDAPGGAANKMMRNNGDGTFTNIIAQTGINASDLGAWNCDAADFDNNGFVDIFSEMSTEMYWNQGNATFTGENLNFDSGGIGDFNNDGFLDVITGNNVWINNGNNNNYVKFYLEGIVSNKSAVGARVEIYGSWGVQIREVRAGRSFDPASSLGVHFGLGTAQSIDQVVIYWPSGIVTTIPNPDINELHHVIEASCINPPVEIAASGPAQICPGSTVTLTAPESDSYIWSNGASTQSIEVSNAANYSVVVWNDEECASLSNTIQVSIIEEETPILSISGENVVCAGDEVTITSTIAQSYLWSNGQITQSIQVTESGDYSVSISGQCSGVAYESAVMHVDVLNNPLPVAEDVIIGESGQAMLTATGTNLEWFATETSEEVLGTGNSFETAFFNDEISYWVQGSTVHNGEQMTGGKEDISGGGGLPSTGGKMIFDATEPFTLMQVTVNVPETSVAGNRTLELFDSNGTLIDSQVIYCPLGTNAVDVNMEIPAGTGLQIGCAENNLFRNNNITGFPFAIGDIGSITNTTFGTSYYYYFYDWKVRKADVTCTSPRVEVTAYVVNVEEEVNPLGVQLYPNPVADNLTISSGQNLAAAQFYITDLTGRTVVSQQLSNNNSNNINVANLAAGVYHAIVIRDGKKSVIEFMKQ